MKRYFNVIMELIVGATFAYLASSPQYSTGLRVMFGFTAGMCVAFAVAIIIGLCWVNRNKDRYARPE